LGRAWAVIKVGGSVFTDKRRPFSIDTRSLEDVCRAIRRALDDCVECVALVHGGGSFGHYVVSEHGGLATRDAFCQTVFFMRELNQVVVEMLNLYGVPAVGIDTHAFVGRLDDLGGVVEIYMERGIVPVLYGDAFISERGFEVVSGDLIAWRLAQALKVTKLVFVTGVGGILRDGRIVSRISIEDALRVVGKARGYDVTGGMAMKISLGIDAIREIGHVHIVGRECLYQALCEEEPSCGTMLEP